MQSPLDLDAAHLDRLLKAFQAARSRLILLDYDGTLKPFYDRPEDAFPDPELLELIRALAGQPRTDLAVVTGRGRENMRAWLGNEPVSLSTEHGLWIRWMGDTDWSHMLPAGIQADVLTPARLLLEDFVRDTPGSRLETKDSSLAWHYRQCDSNLLPGRPRAVMEALGQLQKSEGLPLDILDGKMVIEARIQGVHKGNVVEFLAGRERSYDFHLAMGDDATDENMFTALPGNAFTIKVGEGSSAARLRTENVESSRSLLRALSGM